MNPSELVPQLNNPAVRKREMKIFEKDQKKERLMELEQERNQFEISQGFEGDLYQEKNYEHRYYEGQITDTNKVMENCNKMTSILQMIDRN